MIAELGIEPIHSKIPSFVYPHQELLQLLLSPLLSETLLNTLLTVTLVKENASALINYFSSEFL